MKYYEVMKSRRFGATSKVKKWETGRLDFIAKASNITVLETNKNIPMECILYKSKPVAFGFSTLI